MVQCTTRQKYKIYEMCRYLLCLYSMHVSQHLVGRAVPSKNRQRGEVKIVMWERRCMRICEFKYFYVCCRVVTPSYISQLSTTQT